MHAFRFACLARRRALLGTLLLVAIASLLAASMTTATRAHAAPSATNLPGTLTSAAYASYLIPATGPGAGQIGPEFPVSLSCAQSSDDRTSSGAGLNLGTFGSSGTTTDEALANRTPSVASTQASSNIQGVNALGGVIKADSVNAVVVSVGDANNVASANNSNFTNLIIGGQQVPATPAANTRIDLPGLGYVIVNEQNGPNNTANSTSILLYALDVYITANGNGLNLPVGTRIIIGAVSTSFSRDVTTDAVSSYTFGLYATGLANAATSGPYAQAGVTCQGGNDTEQVGNVSVPSVLSTGSINDSAAGTISATDSQTGAVSQVQGVNLLGGALQADTITATATARRTSAGGTAAATTTFNNGQLAGQALPTNPAPNTRVDIPGIGYAILNEQVIFATSNSAASNMNAVDLYVTQSNNTLGLPVNARIVVGHAQAAVNA